MEKVVIAGIGQTKVGEHWDLSLRELAFFALEDAIADAGGMSPQAMYVGNMLSPALSHQSNIGTLIADFAGLQGIEAYTVESADASGGAAIRNGYLAIASGAVDVALVLGVEKMSDQTAVNVNQAVATTTDADYEAEHGMTATAAAALLMQRYQYEFDIPEHAFAQFPVIAHANGQTNKNAMFQRAIKTEMYQRAGIIAPPLNMFDAAPYADGAAALILTRPELLPKDAGHKLVEVTGSSMVTDTLSLHDRPNPMMFNSARLSVERARKQAGVSLEDIHLFELHDSYSIYAALSLEAAGYAKVGEGWKLAEDGKLAIDSDCPISTFGGLKARGNPGGASGVYQAVEATLQLRGAAENNQVKDAKIAMIQSLGGPASSAVTHILSQYKA
jgi:acetyl-CoA C-acetyltransferase